MRIIKIISTVFLFIFISFGTIGGCGSSGDGDDDDVSCEEFFEVFCDKALECELVTTFEECELVLAFFGVNCDILEISAPQQCIDDINDLACEEIGMDEAPDSCEEGTVEVVGGCEVCEDDADCPEGLSCSECFEDCTGNVMRCGVPFGFLECEDGIFRTIE